MILGAYRVEGTIGAGSMGEVFRGIDTGLNRRVAIKILSEKHRDSPELRARFVREGRAVAAISHPNVVQVFATGTYDERPYIAMELLDGTDLGTTVEKSGPLESLLAAHAVLDAAQGLAAASKAGLIHRDVKPSNLVRLSDGRVKVTDFGLAKPVEPGAEPALTAMGVVVGTPDYIAPEQARGERIDERVDVYALGGTLYFLLTAVPPFRTGKPAEDKYLKVVSRHLRNPPPFAAETNPSCDRELAELARAMMAKRPQDRPSYEDLVAQLRGIIARLDSPVRAASVVPERARTAPAVASSDGGLDLPPRPAIPGWIWFVTVACLALFGVGLVMYLQRPPASGTTSGVVSPPPSDAAVTAADAPGAPVAVAGMVLIKKPDGSPWFYADPRPLTRAAYQQVFAKHEQPGTADAPVVMVSYTEAKSYALTHGGRLLTGDEWLAASTTPGFIIEPGLSEWVESIDEKKKTIRGQGKPQTRPDAKQKDVTFRTARNP
jgi:serine/threonine-protein kinase